MDKHAPQSLPLYCMSLPYCLIHKGELSCLTQSHWHKSLFHLLIPITTAFIFCWMIAFSLSTTPTYSSYSFTFPACYASFIAQILVDGKVPGWDGIMNAVGKYVAYMTVGSTTRVWPYFLPPSEVDLVATMCMNCFTSLWQWHIMAIQQSCPQGVLMQACLYGQHSSFQLWFNVTQVTLRW